MSQPDGDAGQGPAERAGHGYLIGRDPRARQGGAHAVQGRVDQGPQPGVEHEG
ncbi:hypothetical protein [Phenylobacterium sp.]|jgi:hypothetical protein|uniref:hypothetical protein n=1 Tax=Phenylobacterium sp. TaxID=1871053 RepID=UPI0037CBF9D5